MKRLKYNINNILWLCKPYWKYDRAYFILYILTSFAFFPFGDIIYIYLPERVVDLLMQGKSLSYMVFFVSIACCISFLTHMFPSFFYPTFQKKQARINQLVNKEIYEKGLATDYKFIDNPEYYNKFSWAINEYSNQVNSAREFISRFCQYFFSISVLLTIIATIGPWILLIECIQLILQAVFNSYSQKLSISQKNEMLPIDRKMGYLHRVFYLKQYAADLKTTLLSTKLFHEYAQNGKAYVTKTEFKLYSVRVSDRFSDLGIVGAIAIEGDELQLFSLSCRALGRDAEITMLNWIKERHKIIKYRFSNTSKNDEIKAILKEYKVSSVESGKA